MHRCDHCRQLTIYPPTKLGGRWICTPCVVDPAPRAVQLRFVVLVIIVAAVAWRFSR